MAINEKYSFKSFTHQTFTKVVASEFNDSEIVGSSFYQESAWDSDSLSVTPKDPMADVFPPLMTGVTFIRCNLDNCNIPAGNTVGERCSARKLRVQNDLEDWILDVDHKPIEPIDKNRFEEKGVSILPKDIPATKQTKPIID